ncbi:hypothetical protein KP509_01G101500 [Ceratopteris richardii]|uniref:Endoglucanase n=1 Tax=Ceratopteris richardii TaxID=49495 RepID=A0A8T2VNP1_CERRI|nr:hypothetical protein KP509_01G101500 [Ceratopteris richardii]KAH7447327.1 hypothetical protein KP509_01G101500 [Ceratopteris richardii]KAH7447328.1 hypothetical protein KP509_01G101500 [Ceratopteris richardii]
MHAHNAWGGSFDVSVDSATDDDRSRNMDFDRASLQRLEETHQSWLLGPADKKKKDQQVDLGCMVCSKKLLKKIGLAVLAGLVLIGIIVMIVKLVPRHHPPPPPEDSYTKALHKVLMFFNAQKSGKLTKSNNVAWRASSALRDGEPTTDLSGGYYDAGDNIKFGFPGAFAMTILSWSAIEYRDKYESIGELSHVRELIKWGTDYILKTFNKSADSISQVYAQVGVGSGTDNNDHTCWERPEDMDYDRPALTCGSCSDLAAEMAAALAAASVVFKDDRKYSETLVHGAKVLFDFARGPRSRYSASVPDAEQFYNSTGYWDEYVWGSAWLYFATGNSIYLLLSTNRELAKHADGIDTSLDNRVFSWDNKLPGAQLVLTRLRLMMNPGFPYEDVLNLFNNQTDMAMCSYLPQFKAFNVTKGGLVQLNRGRPQPLQYNAAAAFLAALYADYLVATDIPGWNCGPTFLRTKALRDFARSQIDYILGDNPNKMSYVVGYSTRYPTHVHHRGASIPSNVGSGGCTTALRYRDTRSPNPHVLVGAMVAGPDTLDRFADVRTNFNYTEPTLVGNAFLTAALIALSGGDARGHLDTNTLFSAIPPLFPPAPPPPAPWKP